MSYLYGGTVNLETTEFEMNEYEKEIRLVEPEYEIEYEKVRVVYTCDGQKVKRIVISEESAGGKEA